MVRQERLQSVLASQRLKWLKVLRLFPVWVSALVARWEVPWAAEVAMRAALQAPEAMARLLVCDIAPVRYAPGFLALVQAMAAIPLHAGLRRAEADAALAELAPPGVRGFLLQNLRLGVAPHWRVNLEAITAALADWPEPAGAPYAGPVLFVAGARSDYIRPEHRAAIRALFPRARFVTVKAAGHWVHADNPAGFAAVVEAFLASG